MKKTSFLVIFLIIINFITLHSKDYMSFAADEALTLYLGEVKVVPVNKPTRIVIANPSVIDVTDVSNNDMTIAAKGIGSTTLVYWDNFGEQSFRVKVFAEDTNEIKRRIDNLLEKINVDEVYTKAEDEEGKVLLLGRVKNPQDREKITIALGPLKDKTVDLISFKEEESIVEIDVQILELNRDATSTLGFTWPGSLNLLEKNSPNIGSVFKIEKLQRATTAGTDPFSLKLDALIQEGKARILSRPRLLCQSGKEAQMLVGGEKPILTTNVVSSVSGGSTNVEYKEFGIKLSIKPMVTEEDRIKLALNVEVSDVGEAEILGSTSSPSARAYPLSKRTASTELYLSDGQTMSIGGLIKQKTEEDLRKFPWLADVPVLGMFFRQRVTKIGKGAGARDDTELFITLTPKIAYKEPKKISGAVASASSHKMPQEAASFQETAIPANLSLYARIVQERIINAIYYPRQAKEAGWEGNVTLSLNLTSSGDVKEIKIAQSSGYKIIDNAALEVATKQAPYPPFPPQIDSSDLWVEVPIHYKTN